MKSQQLEALILKLWLTTRIPLTQLHLQHLSGLSRKKLYRYLSKLTVNGVLVSDVTPEGEFIWSVPGTARSTSGAQSIAEYEKLESLGSPVGAQSLALAKLAGSAMQARALGSARERSGDESNRKSVVASGLLSFFFGPLGWLYAGSFREAIPACGAAILASAILPSFLWAPLAGILGPVSAIGGVLYALQYNRKGERTRLLSGSEQKQLSK